MRIRHSGSIECECRDHAPAQPVRTQTRKASCFCGRFEDCSCKPQSRGIEHEDDAAARSGREIASLSVLPTLFSRNKLFNPVSRLLVDYCGAETAARSSLPLHHCTAPLVHGSQFRILGRAGSISGVPPPAPHTRDVRGWCGRCFPRIAVGLMEGPLLQARIQRRERADSRAGRV